MHTCCSCSCEVLSDCNCWQIFVLFFFVVNWNLHVVLALKFITSGGCLLIFNFKLFIFFENLHKFLTNWSTKRMSFLLKGCSSYDRQKQMLDMQIMSWISSTQFSERYNFSTMNNLQSKRSVSNELLFSSFFFTAHNTERKLLSFFIFCCSITRCMKFTRNFPLQLFIWTPTYTHTTIVISSIEWELWGSHRKFYLLLHFFPEWF